MFWKAVFLLTGTTIGAGIFALPYTFLLAGPITASLGLFILTLATLALNLLYLQIIIRTPGDRQLPGYAQYWLGKKGKKLALLAIISSTYGALFAYVVLGGNFLALVIGQPRSILSSLIFYLAGSLLAYRGLKTIAGWEDYLSAGLILLVLLLPLSGRKYFHPANLTIPPSNYFAFYGPVLFALSGLAVIPEVEEVLRKKHSLLKRAVIAGTIIPALVYLLFSWGILALSGPMTTTDVLTGLLTLSPFLARVGAAVGVLATFTSFLSLTNVIKEVFFRDLRLKKGTALNLALLPPLLAVFSPPESFLKIVSLTGEITIPLAGLVICLIGAKINQASSRQ